MILGSVFSNFTRRWEEGVLDGNLGLADGTKSFRKPRKVDEVLEAARRAKEAGSTRFCMGTAWRGVGEKKSFQHILTMVKDREIQRKVSKHLCLLFGPIGFLVSFCRVCVWGRGARGWCHFLVQWGMDGSKSAQG